MAGVRRVRRRTTSLAIGVEPCERRALLSAGPRMGAAPVAVDASEPPGPARSPGARAAFLLLRLGLEDGDGDGRITRRDLLLERRCLRLALRSRFISIGLAPGSDPDGDGVVAEPQVRLVGQTRPFARVFLDRGADGSLDGRTRADALGRFQIGLDLAPGANLVRVQATRRLVPRLSATLGVTRIDAAPPPVDRPLRVSPVLDVEHTVTTTVGPGGGTVRTVAADGTVYTLTIPAGALGGDREISLTPVATIPDLSLDGGLLAAAQFGPEGLVLNEPATLVVQLPAVPDTIGTSQFLVGFGYDGEGDGFHLRPVASDPGSTSLEFAVVHFSGVGAGGASASRVRDLAGAPTPGLEATFLSQISLASVEVAELVCGGPCGPGTTIEQAERFQREFETRLLAILRDWYTSGVRPLLDRSPLGDAELDSAELEFLGWNGHVQALLCNPEGDCPLLVPSGLQAMIDEGFEFLGFGYLEAFRRAERRCDDARVLELLGRVELLNLFGRGGLPDTRGELQDAFACRLVIEVEDFPDFVVPGQRFPLVVRILERVGDALVPISGEDVIVTVRECGTVADDLFRKTSQADAAGFVREEVTVLDDPLCGELVVQVEVPDIFIPTAQVRILLGRSRTLTAPVAGIRVEPEAATLAPGQSRQFSAFTFGLSDDTVVWTATGGAIDQQGLFTAGNTPGTFVVTASSLAAPGRQAGATVTITPGRVAEGDFDIQGDGQIEQLGLAGVVEITGNLNIFGQVTDLSGLSSLARVGGNLRISGTSNLTDLRGLDGLTSVGGTLDISRNSSLIRADLRSATFGTDNPNRCQIFANPALKELRLGRFAFDPPNQAGSQSLSLSGNARLELADIARVDDVSTFFINGNSSSSPNGLALRLGTVNAVALQVQVNHFSDFVIEGGNLVRPAIGRPIGALSFTSNIGPVDLNGISSGLTVDAVVIRDNVGFDDQHARDTAGRINNLAFFPPNISGNRP